MFSNTEIGIVVLSIFGLLFLLVHNIDSLTAWAVKKNLL